MFDCSDSEHQPESMIEHVWLMNPLTQIIFHYFWAILCFFYMKHQDNLASHRFWLVQFHFRRNKVDMDVMTVTAATWSGVMLPNKASISHYIQLHVKSMFAMIGVRIVHMDKNCITMWSSNKVDCNGYKKGRNHCGANCECDSHGIPHGDVHWNTDRQIARMEMIRRQYECICVCFVRYVQQWDACETGQWLAK